MAETPRNLTLSRAPVNVWERPGWSATLGNIDRERLIYGASGALLTAYGMRRGGWIGRALAAAGGGMMSRAIAGNHDLTRARAWLESALDARGYSRGRHDRVSDNSDESFPASDPPSWTPTSGVKTKDERARGREG